MMKRSTSVKLLTREIIEQVEFLKAFRQAEKHTMSHPDCFDDKFVEAAGV
jgi:transketolase